MVKKAEKGMQGSGAEREALLAAGYYEAGRRMDEGRARLSEKQDPTGREVRYLLSGAARRYERAVAAMNTAGISEKVFGPVE